MGDFKEIGFVEQEQTTLNVYLNFSLKIGSSFFDDFKTICWVESDQCFYR